MELILFGVTATVAIVGAVAMLLTRNAVHSALFLLLNFSAVAVLYLLLQAPFLFVSQMIVYAGAIMVLFLFVVMLLGAERAEEAHDKLAWQRPLALLLAVVLMVELVFVGVAGMFLPLSQEIPANFGDPKEISTLLFTQYLLPMQVAGILLLVGLMGVVVLNRQATKAKQSAEAP